VRKIRYLRVGMAVVVGVLTVLAFAKHVYPVKIFDFQFTALLQRVITDFSLAALIFFLSLLVLTLIFGRIYCSVLCPFGLLQEALMILFRRRVAQQPGRPYKYFVAAVVFGTLVGGTAGLVRLIDPYSLFGGFAGGSIIGIIAVSLTAVLVWFKGRLFCSNICPVGTILGLFSKHAVQQIYIKEDYCVSCGACSANCPTGSIDYKHRRVNNETCIKCFKCLKVCNRNAVFYGKKPQEEVPFSSGRRQLLLGSAAAVFLLAVRGGIGLSKVLAARVKKVILPPGADNTEVFVNRCLNCHLCAAVCPMKIIRKADEDYPAVHIDYADSFCDYDCNRCAQVCPSGAIKRLSLAEKQRTQIGVALVNESVCVKCGLCVMECPRQIISKEEGSFPQISSEDCIGCGTCQAVCPVQAITISAVNRQRIL